ncbi:MAG: DUF1801 domain-containing protein [Cellulomonas sp.]
MARGEVDGFIDGLQRPWQQRTCRDLLAITRASSPSLAESLKWGQPHFDGRRAVVKWYCAAGWTNVIFYRGHRLDDGDGLFEPTGNARMRNWRITPEEPVVGRGFDRLLTQAVALDMSGT